MNCSFTYSTHMLVTTCRSGRRMNCKLNSPYWDNFFFFFKSCRYTRDWRYHIDEKVWLTQAPGLDGTFWFFDPLMWRKVTKEFHLNEDRLEHQPRLPLIQWHVPLSPSMDFFSAWKGYLAFRTTTPALPRLPLPLPPIQTLTSRTFRILNKQ